MRGDSLEVQYLRAYGAVLTAAETARVLGYNSTDALAKARARGVLPVPMFKIAHRRGWFADTTAVAAWMSEQRMPHAEANMS